MHLYPSCITYIKINFKQLKDINLKYEIIKVSDKKNYNPAAEWVYLSMTQNSEVINFDHNKN